MLIWLDTTNLETIQKAIDMGLLFGITTNPIILSESGKSVDTVLGELLHHQDGPLAIQVIAEDTHGMVEQAKILYNYSERIIVKIPVTRQGIEALHILSDEDIPTMATAILHPYQAFIASMAGANFVAPYLSHIEKGGKSAIEALKTIHNTLQKNELNTEVIAASVDSVDLFQKCAEMGIPHITIKDQLFNDLTKTPFETQEWVSKFISKWSAAKLIFPVSKA